MNEEIKRMKPDKSSETAKERHEGNLKIFLGYAPGVGKTYAMLNEANRRKQRGQDIVIGYVETYGRDEVEKQIGDLEVIPRKKIEYNGVVMDELDTDAVIARKPETVLIDELAHTNVPGSESRKRYEDVDTILKNGINVITTLNIQHLESLNDVIRKVTGVHVRDTIPDIFVENADEVVVVDITPEALQNRVKRGDILQPDKVDRALRTYFREGSLNALREIALRQTADEVDEDLAEYMKDHGIRDNWQTAERVMVCISTNKSAKKLIRRGARIAKRYKCEWLVVYVNCTNKFAPSFTPTDRVNVENSFKLARQLGAHTVMLEGKSVSGELSAFAQEKHVTQIFIGHSTRTRIETMLRGSTITKLLKKAKNIEVHVIPNDY